MPSQRELMLAGQLYDPLDPELTRARERARDLCQDLNATREAQHDERRRILRELLGAGGDDVWLQPPFFCDYGTNILLGRKCFFNFNCIVLDVCQVRIGDYTLFGAAVQIYTATRHDRLGRVDRRRSNHLPGHHDRLSVRDWSGERDHPRHSRRRLCRRQPVPHHPGGGRIERYGLRLIVRREIGGGRVPYAACPPVR